MQVEYEIKIVRQDKMALQQPSTSFWREKKDEESIIMHWKGRILINVT